jgi:hypothetical protein
VINGWVAWTANVYGGYFGKGCTRTERDLLIKVACLVKK